MRVCTCAACTPPASWGRRSVAHAASARRQLVSGGSWGAGRAGAPTATACLYLSLGSGTPFLGDHSGRTPQITNSKIAVSQKIISESGREESSGKILGRSVLFLQVELAIVPILGYRTFAVPPWVVVGSCWPVRPGPGGTRGNSGQDPFPRNGEKGYVCSGSRLLVQCSLQLECVLETRRQAGSNSIKSAGLLCSLFQNL